jgi:hypothetical protein
VPIKLKEQCPAASRFGNDPPLWKTVSSDTVPRSYQAMIGFCRILDDIATNADDKIWAQAMDIIGVMLTSPTDEMMPMLDTIGAAVQPRLDVIPGTTVIAFADILRRASLLHHYDTDCKGTTAPAVKLDEAIAYRALDLLVSLDMPTTRPAMVDRFRDALTHFVNDAKIRGRMPLSR